MNELLQRANYDSEKTKYLISGFRNGFSLEFGGKVDSQVTSPNLKLRVGSLTELWNKVMIEVKVGRYAGPFEKVPFEHFIQSPIGLVPKDSGHKTRLIFHLSYPRSGNSVNSGIDPKLCKVKYPDFGDAVKICFMAGKNCHIAKSDMSMAFRNIPLNKMAWKVLILKAYHPVTKRCYYFVDKCLPFGSSISCKIFQEFSNSVAHLVKHETKKDLVNYLNDYFFLHY